MWAVLVVPVIILLMPLCMQSLEARVVPARRPGPASPEPTRVPARTPGPTRTASPVRGPAASPVRGPAARLA